MGSPCKEYICLVESFSVYTCSMVDIIAMVNKTLFIPSYDVIPKRAEIAKAVASCDGGAFVYIQALTEPWQVFEKFGLTPQDHFETVLSSEQ